MKYPIPYKTHDEPVAIGGTKYFYSVRWDALKKAQRGAGIGGYDDVRAANGLLEAMEYAVEQSFADQEDMGTADDQDNADSGWVIYWR